MEVKLFVQQLPESEMETKRCRERKVKERTELCRENMREGSQYWRVVKSDQRLGPAGTC